jgi:hypothetical protein
MAKVCMSGLASVTGLRTVEEELSGGLPVFVSHGLAASSASGLLEERWRSTSVRLLVWAWRLECP